MLSKEEALVKVKGKASLKTMMECAVTLVHSIIDFCSELYLYDEANQKKIQKTLNFAMITLVNKVMGNSCTDMLVTLGWLNAANMHRWVTIRTLRRLRTYPSQASSLR